MPSPPNRSNTSPSSPTLPSGATVLLRLKPAELRIQQVSGTAIELLGQSAQSLRKQPLADFLPPAQIKQLRQALQATHPPQPTILALQWRKGKTTPPRILQGRLHHLGKSRILELSPIPQTDSGLRQQVEQERILAAIAQNIRESLDLQTILAAAVTEVQALLQADRVLVYRVWDNGTGSAIAEATAPGWIKVLDLIFPEEVFPEEARLNYLQGRIYTLTDRDREDVIPCLAEFLVQIQVRAKLVIPIIQQDELWGLLIAHQCSQPRQWLEWEINLLQQIATQMAIAIQQSELYQQLQEELSERKRIENALRQSEALFRSLSESSPIGIFRMDTTGQWIYTNPRCQMIGGFSFEAALQDGWKRFIHNDDRDEFWQQWEIAAAENQEFSAEVRFVRRDGIIRFCRIQTAPVFSAQDELTGHVGTVEDITESRAIAQMKNEFISIVSHELRTPLTAIRGSLGLLANGVYDQKPQRGKRMLQIASTQTDRLVRLVNDILDLGRLESGRVTLAKQPCSVLTLMLQSVDAMRVEAEQNGITLSFLPLNIDVWADPDSIIQTLTNLISNAIKFSKPSSTVWITAELIEDKHHPQQRNTLTPPRDRNSQTAPTQPNPNKALRATEAHPLTSSTAFPPQLKPPYVLFQVKDQGRGIPADKLESIFGQFQQVDASDSRKKGGTGLGLAICRSIIQQHGGRIWADSVLGKGSTFYFTLLLPPRP
ncbi:ATP-binding protein [Alkalinema sp. FACHB-956]|uniref:ATP-binding protein n=1 Tax=Alkalinema sp. FACHB-956 TaxID=2692768 RepID=UPI0016861486|nr:ATP-binding protein [Alkalinema sp. FACHB-956]MBD2327860.1 PAS domain S-box protein [Alkalinema sp. FACHB-956]